jgi:hypothetical protein
MIGTDLYVAERSMSLYVDEARREAARLPARGSVRAFAVVVRQLSLLLVSLGGRLVAYGLPPTPVGAASVAPRRMNRRTVPRPRLVCGPVRSWLVATWRN